MDYFLSLLQNRGFPVLAFFARAGTMLPIRGDLSLPRGSIAVTARITCALSLSGDSGPSFAGAGISVPAPSARSGQALARAQEPRAASYLSDSTLTSCGNIPSQERSRGET